ncbi:hypothetical protein [Streptomyces sp. NPDC048269]
MTAPHLLAVHGPERSSAAAATPGKPAAGSRCAPAPVAAAGPGQ